jgi:hypothetical protein
MVLYNLPLQALVSYQFPGLRNPSRDLVAFFSSESDLNKMSEFIDKNKIGYLKINGIYNNGCCIIESQGKYKLLGTDKNKIRNMDE